MSTADCEGIVPAAFRKAIRDYLAPKVYRSSEMKVAIERAKNCASVVIM
jgi:hypothetical protein